MNIIILNALSILVNIIEFAIIIRCFLSWFPVNRNNPVISLIYTFTEPVLAPIRNMIAKSPLGSASMQLDFSPIFAFLLLGVIMRFLERILG